jgi:hypothetical protein
MKYYTREYYELLQLVGLSDDFKKIPQRTYTTAEIKALYNKALKKEIAADRKFFNTPPEFEYTPESITKATFNPADWVEINESTGEVRKNLTMKEVKERIKKENEEELEAFENRGEFDPNETIEFFKETYKAGLRNAKNFYPDWMNEEVDARLIALGYLPEDAYNRYKAEDKENKKQLLKIERNADRTLSKQRIPGDVMNAVCLHDASLLSLRKNGKNFEMTVALEGYFASDEAPYRKVVFKKARVTEKDKGLRSIAYLDGDIYRTDIQFMYHELYNQGSGYDIHMSFWTPKGIAYLTVYCENVESVELFKID